MVSFKNIFIEKINNFFLTSGILFILFVLNFGALYYLFGQWGAFLLAYLILTTFYFSPNMSHYLIFKNRGGRVLSHQEAPELYQMLRRLCEYEGPQTLPTLVILPDREINALTVESKNSYYIAVTHGLLRSLNEREIYNVFAHELSHILNNDTRIQSFARILGFIALTFSSAGFFLIMLFLPVLLFMPTALNPSFILYLYFGPTLSNLLILKLSRTREFQADLKAIELTQDPIGLVNALKKIAYFAPMGIFQLFGMRPKRKNTGGAFSTHPDPEDRIAKLMSYHEP